MFSACLNMIYNFACMFEIVEHFWCILITFCWMIDSELGIEKSKNQKIKSFNENIKQKNNIYIYIDIYIYLYIYIYFIANRPRC